MHPKVWNKRDPSVPKDAVYVGRPTKWGNPYTHLPINPKYADTCIKVATREDAVKKYKETLPRFIYDLAPVELKGKDLVCWCAPKPCHADVLLEIANK